MLFRFPAMWFPIAAIVFLGCQDSKPLENASSKPASKPAEKELLVRLQAADQLDGDEDKVIHRCYVCNLGMDGKKEHSATHLGYTAHLCSSGCLSEFQRDPAAIIAETAIPTPGAKGK